MFAVQAVLMLISATVGDRAAIIHSHSELKVPNSAEPCQSVVAPSTFNFGTKKKRGRLGSPDNEGIQPTGFVSLRGRSTIHGIDVSKYQDETDFTTAQRCGAKFAYVRLSSATYADNELLYRTHWSNARSSGLITGGYHNLSVLTNEMPVLLKATAAEILANAAQYLQTAVADADVQAKLFSDRLAEVKALDAPRAGLPSEYLPSALDLSQDPFPGGLPNAQKAFAPIYRAAVCRFVTQMKGGSTARPIILMVSLQTYTSYDLSSAGCGLDRVILWIRFRAEDGDSFENHTDKGRYGELCIPAGASISRCKFEQYTSYGGFAIFKPNAGLDLDRFLGTPAEFKGILEGN